MRAGSTPATGAKQSPLTPGGERNQQSQNGGKTKDGLGGNNLDMAHIQWLRDCAGWSCAAGNCHPNCGVQHEKIKTSGFAAC